ncbi:MAG: sugar phosphate isomerase/epimerase [Verrucomicrobia bacterium]|nr:sugar phosphate isomerase/epimerase [Verrucomicrobiota bacterium]
MLAFSTCWNSGRHKDGEAMLREIRELGFENVELGHGIRVSLVPGIQAAIDAGVVRATSLHNFCPLPLEVTGASPDCYEYTSHRPLDVQRALKLTRQTIDFAARLGATYVVLHLGRVPMRPVMGPLGDLLDAPGGRFGKTFVQRKLAAVQQRERLGPAYVQRARDCLRQAADYAVQKNVFLGVESRHSYEEVPTENELVALLDELNCPHVGYWHDFGHVQVKHNLGFLDHHDWLRAIRGRLFGCHLHDTAWPMTDHRVPFAGGVEYDRLVPLLPENTYFVYELHPRQPADAVRTSLARWQSQFPGTLRAATAPPTPALQPAPAAATLTP